MRQGQALRTASLRVAGSGAPRLIAGRQLKRKISKSIADEGEPCCGPAV
jgi:hypothetical protein